MEHRLSRFRKWVRLNTDKGIVFVKSNDGAGLSAALNQAKGYVTVKVVVGYGASYLLADAPEGQQWRVFPTQQEAHLYILKAYEERGLFPPTILAGDRGDDDNHSRL